MGENIKITSIEKQKKNRHRYNIYINDVYTFSVHEDVLIKHRLMKGQEINSTEMQSILEADERQKAYQSALKILSRRAHTSKEVNSKLLDRGFDKELSEIIVKQLVEQQYIDDELFAKMWAIERIKSQKKGKQWIKQELTQKGLTKEQIVHALQHVDEEEEIYGALIVAQKKWIQFEKRSDDRLQNKRKLFSYLQRRGFEQSIIRKVIQTVINEDIEEF